MITTMCRANWCTVISNMFSRGTSVFGFTLKVQLAICSFYFFGGGRQSAEIQTSMETMDLNIYS